MFTSSARILTLSVSLVAAFLALTTVNSSEATNSGDHFLAFPWKFGRTAYITQGYNGGTHINGNKYAVDFDVDGPSLGDIRTATAGLVVGRRANLQCDVIHGDYGNYVDIRSTTPTGETRYARYAHMSSVAVLSDEGAYRGMKIGVEGDTGKTYKQNGQPCGPHLHFVWTSVQGCSSTSCAVMPEPMSGGTGFAAGQTKTSDNYPFKAEFSGDGCSDLVGRFSNGDAYSYRGNCTGWWNNGGAGTQINGSNWNVFTWLLGPGDFNSDGCADMIGRFSDGSGYLYRANCNNGWKDNGAGTQINTFNWNTLNWMIGPGDFDGDGCTDMIGRNTSGNGYLYRGNCGGGWGLTSQINGSSWNGFTWIFAPGDFDGDGCADMVGRFSDGDAYLYRGNCSGSWKYNGVGLQINLSNWNVLTWILGPGDFDSDGCADMIGKFGDGSAYLYRGDCAGSWKDGGAGSPINGSSWNVFTWMW